MDHNSNVTTPWKEYAERGTRYRIRATYGMEWLQGNRAPYFHITGEIEQQHGRRWIEASGGCLHDAIGQHFPELAALIPWHLAEQDTGADFHYEANAVYWWEDAHKPAPREWRGSIAVDDSRKVGDDYLFNVIVKPDLAGKLHVSPTGARFGHDFWVEAERVKFGSGEPNPFDPAISEAGRQKARDAFAHTVRLGVLPNDAPPNPETLPVLQDGLGRAIGSDIRPWLADRLPQLTAAFHACMARHGVRTVVPEGQEPPWTPEPSNAPPSVPRAKRGDEQSGEWMRGLGITFAVEPAEANPQMPEFEGNHWRVVLKRGSRQVTVHFSKGTAHHGAEPTPDEVFECLASDAASVENARDFADWCADFGYDTDSLKARKTYTACVRQSKRLKNLLGDAYREFVFGEPESDPTT